MFDSHGIGNEGKVEDDRAKLSQLLTTNIKHYLTVDNPEPSPLLPKFLDMGLTGRLRAKAYLKEILEFDNDKADANALLKKVAMDYIDGVADKGVFKSSKVLHKIIRGVLCAYLGITSDDIQKQKNKKMTNSADITIGDMEDLSKDSIIIADIIKEKAHLDVKPVEMQKRSTGKNR